MENEKFIRLENISMSYPVRGGIHQVLKDINLQINYGDKIGILGRNGSGKTTLIKIIGGVLKPIEGNVIRKMRVSWPIAFQGGFQGSLTGFDNLRFICRTYGVQWEDKVRFIKDFAELGKYLYEPAKTYSSGMRARLAFAISLSIEFDCYLIDEVLAVGDSRFRKRCEEELFIKRKDRSFIIVSHQPAGIQKYANRFFVLQNGELLEFDKFRKAWVFYSNNQVSGTPKERSSL